MNIDETTLAIVITIILLLGLIAYSFFFAPPKHKKTAESQAASLKNMLDEYATKVQSEEYSIDKKFESLHETIPTKQYAMFSNERAVNEMGLTQEEADEFVLELIKAIEGEVPKIEEGIMRSEYKVIEEIVHTITGTSSTLGSGGVSSALISFYAAIQHRDDLQKLYIHLQNVKYYLAELKTSVEK